MKILQVVSTLAPRQGGPSVDVDGLGHLDVPLDRPVIDDGVKVYYFRGLSEPTRYMFSRSMWRALRDTVSEFDVVHIYSVYGFSSSATAYWCRRQGVPYMVHPHGSLDPYLRRRHRFRKWIHAKLFANRDYQKAAGILFNSAEEMRLASDWSGLAQQATGGRGRPRRFVVPVGLDARWLEPADPAAGQRFRNNFPTLIGRRLITYFGRINFKKGLDILARAYAKVARDRDDVHLVLAGPDTEGYGKKVRAWLEEDGVLDKATFTGLLSGEDRFTALREAEILALTSYTENFGQVVAEAMASGVPVVISDRVNIWPEVAKTNAGLVVPCDVDAAARALCEMLDDPIRGKEMGSNGRSWVAENLPWKVVAAQMAGAYEEIASHQKPRDFALETAAAR
jgi:glycosyltransferase involved in cell wall biosynthesis